MGGELRSKLWLGVAYFVVLEALIVAAMLYWPQFAQNLDHLKSLMPLGVLREMAEQIEASGLSAYVHAQHYFKGCNALGGLAAVLFAMFAVAGEVQRGTLEVWLLRPVSRRRLLGERWLAGAFWVALPVVLSSATLPWLASVVDERLELGALLLCAVHQSAFLVAVYSLTFLLSCLFTNPLVLGFAMLLAALAELALYMIEHVTHSSVFRLVDVATYMGIYDGDGLPWPVTGGLVAFSALCFVLSQAAFARKTP